MWYHCIEHYNGRSVILPDYFTSSHTVMLFTDTSGSIGFVGILSTERFALRWDTVSKVDYNLCHSHQSMHISTRGICFQFGNLISHCLFLSLMCEIILIIYFLKNYSVSRLASHMSALFVYLNCSKHTSGSLFQTIDALPISYWKFAAHLKSAISVHSVRSL